MGLFCFRVFPTGPQIVQTVDLLYRAWVVHELVV
jgi:hypothetical protein